MRALAVCVLNLFLLQVVRLLRIDDVFSGVKVCLVRFDTSTAGEEHVSEEHGNIERNSKVSCNEVFVVKLGVFGVDKDVEVLCQTNKNDKGQADDGPPESLRSDIRHGTIGNVLGAASAQEEEVGDKDGNPSQYTKDSNKVNEIAKDLIIVSE